MEDKTNYESEFAQELLSHFYRWLTSPTGSKMYDPLLHRMIHKMMMKGFLYLVDCFKKRDCKIIYARFDKLIVQTTKRDYEEAQAHMDFVIAKIR